MKRASLCESCSWMREVISGRGSRFLLCRLSAADPAYSKYPMQPVVRCGGHRPAAEDPADGAVGHESTGA